MLPAACGSGSPDGGKGPGVRGPLPQGGWAGSGEFGVAPIPCAHPERGPGSQRLGALGQLLGVSPSLPPSRSVGVGTQRGSEGWGEAHGTWQPACPNSYPTRTLAPGDQGRCHLKTGLRARASGLWVKEGSSYSQRAQPEEGAQADGLKRLSLPPPRAPESPCSPSSSSPQALGLLSRVLEGSS